MIVIRRRASRPEAGTAQLLGEARRRVTEVRPGDALQLMRSGAIDVVVDVRERDEWNHGHVPGAVHAPRGMLEWFADPGSSIAHPAITGNRTGSVVTVCATGARSLLAALTLLQMGYTHVASMRGGYQEWIASGLPSEAPRRPSKFRP
jgi:rhodanese-related sulfurtransferase